MRIGFRGELLDEKEIRAGFIGCGSHSFRNVYPTFQFAPVDLVAVCDLSIEKARAFAGEFGAGSAYSDHHRMLGEEDIDAVFIVVGYDQRGRPLYPQLVKDCLDAGCHVWLEKPPAASCREVEEMKQAADRNGRHVLVGFKKMFFPANEKAGELMSRKDFGKASLVTLQYPQYVPTMEEFEAWLSRGERNKVVGFLDHLCHPVSLLVFLMGMPGTLCYERSASGAGAATFTFDSGAVASLVFNYGSSRNAGMERTVIVSDSGRHITVDNNLRVTYHRDPKAPEGRGYGNTPDFYAGEAEDTAAFWEPEFSLGQLYNKGLFLLGYYNEVNEFARAVLEGRAPAKGTLEQARQITRIFEAFFDGPGKAIPLA